MFSLAAGKKERRCASSPSTHTTTTHQTSAPTVRNGNSRVSSPQGDAHVSGRISQQKIMSEGGIMSRKFYVILGTLSLMLVSSTAQAQSVAAKVSVPFAFAASQSAFPAGEYRITTMGPEQPSTFLISGDGHHAFILPHAERSTPTTAARPKL